jgi:hypothetical protein
MFKVRVGMGPIGNEIGFTIWEIYFWKFGTCTWKISATRV